MKVSFKLLLWTVVILVLSLGFSGFFFVNYVFETSVNREVEQALDENSILRFAFETAALNVPAKYDFLSDTAINQIAWSLETENQRSVRLLRFSDEQHKVLYSSTDFSADTELLAQTGENMETYRVLQQEDRYYIQTCTVITILNRTLYLETLKDITEVFHDRALEFQVYRRVMIFVLIGGTILMQIISSWLTRPIRFLTRATKRMASGDYRYRAKRVSRDELGQLTIDFNRMARALEENMRKLEDEAAAREDFVGAFAHELKTPLTSIIGYADILRSRKVDDEQLFSSANYIYTEGKRLETMSLRLLDIIVTKRNDVKFQMVSVANFASWYRISMRQRNSM